MTEEKYLEDESFRKMISTRTKIVTLLTVLTLVIYFGFIFLLAFGKDLMASRITENITVGLPLGVAVIVLSWLLTYIYATWANGKYDDMVEEIKSRIGG